jgi:hypothetical protein
MLNVPHSVEVDGAPPQAPRPPLSCRLHLWHRWIRVRVEGTTSYVMCERCQRLAPRTIFDKPVP